MDTHSQNHWTDVDLAAYGLVHSFERNGKRGCAAVAPLLGKAPGTICNEVNPDVPTHKASLNDLIAVELAADEFPVLEAHARECGHVVFRVPPIPFVDDIEVLNAFTSWQAKLGQTMQAVHDAFEDRRITNNELRGIYHRADDHMREFQVFLTRLKQIAEEE